MWQRGGGTRSPVSGVEAGDSPRTRFSGSLMLTVWSWEADKELLMDRSAVGQAEGTLWERPLGSRLPFPGKPSPTRCAGPAVPGGPWVQSLRGS